jgi:CMP-N,N'-diacetyllegionaminic acid synthase
LKVLGIIPARGGSKGVPRKNIKLLNGKPLIAYTIEQVLKSHLKDFIVSTEDKEIARISEGLGAIVPFLRTQSLAEDSSSSIDVVLDCLTKYEEFQKCKYDAVMLLQPTTPFRSYFLINECLNEFTIKDYDSLISVKQIPKEYNPHWAFEKKEDGYLMIATGEKEIIKRRQELPNAFYRDGSIYLVSREVILNSKSFYGKKLGFVENKERSINIDTIEDWKIAEDYVKNFS